MDSIQELKKHININFLKIFIFSIFFFKKMLKIYRFREHLEISKIFQKVYVYVLFRLLTTVPHDFEVFVFLRSLGCSGHTHVRISGVCAIHVIVSK